MRLPSVAVVIPCFNRSERLRRALRSVASQTSLPEEVIVCDDGSTEDLRFVTLEFAQSLNIHYVAIPNSGGPARPRNVAVTAATSDWIALLDSDDWWLPNKLERARSRALDADVIYHRLQVRSVDGGNHASAIVGWNHLSRTQPEFDLLTLGNPIPTSAALVRREIYLSAGGMEERYPTIEDYEFWIRATRSQKARFVFLNEVLGFYEAAPDSYSASGAKQAEYLEQILTAQLERFEEREQQAITSYRDFAMAVQFLQAGLAEQARARLVAATHLRTWRQRASRWAKLACLANRWL